LDERALVARAQQGDREAFAQLLRDHHLRVYNLAAYIVGDRTEAEDVTQQAFVRAWEELPRLRDPQAFTAWVNRIARNLARDRAREGGARARFEGPQPDPPETGNAEARGPEESLVVREREQDIHRAVATLSEAHQEVVVMHHLEGKPVVEIAQQLGVPLGTVLSRLARARAALRRKLAPHVEDDRP